MTDAEIMKGVKLCNGDLGNCKECPFDSIGKTCGIELAKAEIGLIERLQAENAALRERLDRAVELPRIIHPNTFEWHIQYQYKSGIIDSKIKFSIEAAEACLKELKEKNND